MKKSIQVLNDVLIGTTITFLVTLVVGLCIVTIAGLLS